MNFDFTAEDLLCRLDERGRSMKIRRWTFFSSPYFRIEVDDHGKLIGLNEVPDGTFVDGRGELIATFVELNHPGSIDGFTQTKNEPFSVERWYPLSLPVLCARLCWT